jgi:DNA-binding protein H-NS
MQKQRSEWEANLKHKNLAAMPVKELWDLHKEIRRVLSTKLDAEKRELERRLVRLNGRIEDKPKARRPYPKVHPNIAIHRVLLKLGLDEESSRAG